MQIPIKAEIELKEDSKSFRKLVQLTARALGWVGEPLHKFLDSKAEASSMVTRARADAEVEEIKYIATVRREHLENRRTKNIQTVVHQTVPLLTDQVSEEPVDEDWAIHFFEQVQDVSDSEMQALWARILAGEITEPKTFSIRTLNFLKSLRKNEAEEFAELCRMVCTFEDNFPLILKHATETNKKYSPFTDFFGVPWHLQNIGLIAPDSMIDTPKLVRGRLKYFDETYRFTDPNHVTTSQKLHKVMGFSYFTMTGAELYRVASPGKIEGYLDAAMAEVSKDLQLGYERV